MVEPFPPPPLPPVPLPTNLGISSLQCRREKSRPASRAPLKAPDWRDSPPGNRPPLPRNEINSQPNTRRCRQHGDSVVGATVEKIHIRTGHLQKNTFAIANYEHKPFRSAGSSSSPLDHAWMDGWTADDGASGTSRVRRCWLSRIMLERPYGTARTWGCCSTLLAGPASLDGSMCISYLFCVFCSSKLNVSNYNETVSFTHFLCSVRPSVDMFEDTV